MKYKILKTFTTTLRTLKPGDEVEWKDNPVPIALKDGFLIPQKELIDQGFIEEVKETPKPRWKVGDKVVREYQTYSPDYLFIYRVTLNSSNVWIYNEDLTESILRDPTPEELSIYFR